METVEVAGPADPRTSVSARVRRWSCSTAPAKDSRHLAAAARGSVGLSSRCSPGTLPGAAGSDDPAAGLSAGQDLGRRPGGFLRAAVPGRSRTSSGCPGAPGIALELYRGTPVSARVPGAGLRLRRLGGIVAARGSRAALRPGARRDSISRRRQFIAEWLPTLFTDKADPAVVAEASAIMADVRPAGHAGTALRQRPGRLPRTCCPPSRIPTLLLYGADDVSGPRCTSPAS